MAKYSGAIKFYLGAMVNHHNLIDVNYIYIYIYIYKWTESNYSSLKE